MTVGCMKSTQAMRDRIRELMSREQDDYDRAVECVLDDLEGLISAPAQSAPQLPPLVDRAELIALLQDLASVNLHHEAVERQARRMADDLIARGLTFAAQPPAAPVEVSKASFCGFCDLEYELHEDAQGFHHVVKGERAPCAGAHSSAGNGVMKFNVNDKVRVKLTDVGRAAILKNHKELFRAHADKFNPRDPNEVDGWSEWQLWDLMREFGPHLTMGFNPPFETDIQFVTGGEPQGAGTIVTKEAEVSEYDQMEAQKRMIVDRQNTRVFEAALQALKVGVPGLSESSKEAVARNIALRVSEIIR